MARHTQDGEIVRKDAKILANAVLRRIDYDTRAEADFETIPLSNIGEERETMRRRWIARELVLVGIFRGKERKGTLFLSAQIREGKKLLFVEGCASQGEKCTYDDFLPELENYARAHGCAGILAETFRPGVFAALNRLGFQPTKIELIKDFSYGK